MSRIENERERRRGPKDAVYGWTLEVVSKPSIRFKVKADRGIQTQEYICNISSIESIGPTQELGLRGGFEITSG